MAKKIITILVILTIIGLIYYSYLNQDENVKFKDKSIVTNKSGHHPWLQFEIDEVNEIITLVGKVKNKKQLKEILAVFTENFPNKTLAHDMELDVLIKRDILLANHLTYLLPSIGLIKVAKIKLTENTLTLGGLVRDADSEHQVINTLKQIFTDEIIIKNSLEKVIQNNNPIKPLEFSLPALPTIENN